VFFRHPAGKGYVMSYVVLDSIRSQNQDMLREQFALDVLVGFSAEAKFLPCKYFYDAEGSRIFEKITDSEEYYLTQCEFEVLQTAGAEIARLIGNTPVEIVELGAGDGRKTKVLLGQLRAAGNTFAYFPVDISESAIAELVASMSRAFPDLQVQGVVGEYFDSIRHLENISQQRKLVLFLGSNIGNFDYLSALRFLRTIWKRLNNNDLLLVGFDLKKDIGVMTRAYNDEQHLTRDFNLNILKRINTELGGNFDLARFAHHGHYNPLRGAMESYLISLEAQQVAIDGIQKIFSFKPFEPIHLEYSYKYLRGDIDTMALDTGFRKLADWTDSRCYFVDSLWQVKKDM
jgi:dimethylhistidine N-methyltransferase